MWQYRCSCGTLHRVADAIVYFTCPDCNTGQEKPSEAQEQDIARPASTRLPKDIAAKERAIDDADAKLDTCG